MRVCKRAASLLRRARAATPGSGVHPEVSSSRSFPRRRHVMSHAQFCHIRRVVQQTRGHAPRGSGDTKAATLNRRGLQLSGRPPCYLASIGLPRRVDPRRAVRTRSSRTRFSRAAHRRSPLLEGNRHVRFVKSGYGPDLVERAPHLTRPELRALQKPGHVWTGDDPPVGEVRSLEWSPAGGLRHVPSCRSPDRPPS